jgi:OOP family OmpA-OmpF porin
MMFGRNALWMFCAMGLAAQVGVGVGVRVGQTTPVRYELSGNELKVPGPVLFQTGSDKLKTESESVLSYVKGYLADKSYISLLRIEVHSDATGNSAANQKLTEQRALSVGRWLVAHGVDCKRLLAVGFGETKPVADNRTDEGRAQNRRVSFVNAELRGRAIGGMPVDGGGKVAGDLCK